MIGFHQNVHWCHCSENMRHIKISLREIIRKLNHWIQLLADKGEPELKQANTFHLLTLKTVIIQLRYVGGMKTFSQCQNNAILTYYLLLKK
jgi:hypothetical protein